MKGKEDQDQDSEGSGRAMLGTLCLYGAAAVFFLAVVDSSSLSFLPQSWHTNRWAWYLGAVIAFFASLFLLKSKRQSESTATSPAEVKAFEHVVLYTREGCHLCDDARDLLTRYSADLPAIEEVDIDSDPALAEKFDTCVPVVEIDGKVRFRGNVNEVLLQRLIDASRPSTGEPVERSA